MKIAKKLNGSASSADHRCAVVKFAPRRSVGGDLAGLVPSTGHRA